MCVMYPNATDNPISGESGGKKNNYLVIIFLTVTFCLPANLSELGK